MSGERLVEETKGRGQRERVRRWGGEGATVIGKHFEVRAVGHV